MRGNIFWKNGWLKRETSTLCVSKAVRYRKGDVSIVEPVILQKRIPRLFHWIKNYLALRGNKLQTSFLRVYVEPGILHYAVELKKKQ